jgi:hypothetical protein
MRRKPETRNVHTSNRHMREVILRCIFHGPALGLGIATMALTESERASLTPLAIIALVVLYTMSLAVTVTSLWDIYDDDKMAKLIRKEKQDVPDLRLP